MKTRVFCPSPGHGFWVAPPIQVNLQPGEPKNVLFLTIRRKHYSRTRA